jgi:hypothetical protein
MLPPRLQNERKICTALSKKNFFGTLPWETCGNVFLETGKTSGKTGEKKDQNRFTEKFPGTDIMYNILCFALDLHYMQGVFSHQWQFV